MTFTTHARVGRAVCAVQERNGCPLPQREQGDEIAVRIENEGLGRTPPLPYVTESSG